MGRGWESEAEKGRRPVKKAAILKPLTSPDNWGTVPLGTSGGAAENTLRGAGKPGYLSTNPHPPWLKAACLGGGCSCVGHPSPPPPRGFKKKEALHDRGTVGAEGPRVGTEHVR